MQTSVSQSDPENLSIHLHSKFVGLLMQIAFSGHGEKEQGVSSQKSPRYPSGHEQVYVPSLGTQIPLYLQS